MIAKVSKNPFSLVGCLTTLLIGKHRYVKEQSRPDDQSSQEYFCFSLCWPSTLLPIFARNLLPKLLEKFCLVYPSSPRDSSPRRCDFFAQIIVISPDKMCLTPEHSVLQTSPKDFALLDFWQDKCHDNSSDSPL